MSETPKPTPPEIVAPSRFDAVVVMGAALHKDADGQLSYPKFSEFRNGKLVDGDIRACAIAQIISQDLTPLVIITGGYEKGGLIMRSRALLEYAHAEYGVPKDRMYPLYTPPHSQGNIKGSIKFLKEMRRHGRALDSSLAFLTNGFHVPRTALFVRSQSFFQNTKTQLTFLPAEQLLTRAGILDKKDVDEYYRSPDIQERIKNEMQGFCDFRNGTYSPKKK